MIRVAVTGLSGVVGRKLAPLLNNSGVNLIELFHSKPSTSFAVETHQIELSSPSSMAKTLKKINTDVIVHLAAVTHIDRCEEDRAYGKDGIVWKTNVVATNNLAEYAKNHDTHLLLLSTECVFDGSQASYDEMAKPVPKNWYGTSKAAAEKSVQLLGNQGTIIRAAIAYHRDDNNQTMFGKIFGAFKKNKPFSVVSDQYMTPTHTEDIVRAIMIVVEKQIPGVLHVSSNKRATPYEFSQDMARLLNLDASLARPVSMKEFLGQEKAALRLKNACLDGTTSQKLLSFKPKTVSEVLS